MLTHPTLREAEATTNKTKVTLELTPSETGASQRVMEMPVATPTRQVVVVAAAAGTRRMATDMDTEVAAWCQVMGLTRSTIRVKWKSLTPRRMISARDQR